MNNKQTIKEYIKILNHATEEYDAGHPVMDDKSWDDIYFALQDLEKETGIVYPNSPTQSIHFEKVSDLKKIRHTHLMLSLDKTKDVADLEKYFKHKDWCAMFKLDGLSCSLVYINGRLDHAETRGNGEIGEDITHNARVIKNIPQQIETKEEVVVIDGEIICNYNEFENFKTEYANPRNFAAGSIRLLDAEECARRNLMFVAWDLIQGTNEKIFYYKLEQLDDWGFDVVPCVPDAQTIEEAIDILNNEQDLEWYPIDGYVFRFVDQDYYNELGMTEHHFRGALAYKFYDVDYKTELLDIEWSMGKTGVLSPIAIFKEVNTGDSIISRANMHNVSTMNELLGKYPELYQSIWVVKANQIIPQVIRAEKNNTKHDHILNNGKIDFCPICGKPVEYVKSESGTINVYCTNSKCEGKIINRICHYCSKKGLEIKGLSIKTLEKLINWGWINGLRDIYRLAGYRTEWVAKEGFGAASVGKILNAIEDSKREVSLAAFISALGVPHIGRTIAKEITKYCKTWQEFREYKDWIKLDGFGPEISKSLLTFDYAEADEIAAMLDFAEIKQDIKPINSIDAVFCVTGKLNHFKNRDELKEYIESIGGKVVNSITSKVDMLITNTPNSGTAKNKSAKEKGILIITEEQFLERYGQNL